MKGPGAASTTGGLTTRDGGSGSRGSGPLPPYIRSRRGWPRCFRFRICGGWRRLNGDHLFYPGSVLTFPFVDGVLIGCGTQRPPSFGGRPPDHDRGRSHNI